MVRIEGRYVVSRLTYVMLQPRADSPEVILAAVRESLPQIRTLHGKFELIKSVGHIENAAISSSARPTQATSNLSGAAR